MPYDAIASIPHLSTGGKFFFQMVEGEDKSRLAVLMTAAYVLAAVVVFLLDRQRLDHSLEVNQPNR